jgi:excisionase family DNA binding protein
MLTVAEAAQRVGRSPGTVRRWIRGGRLHAETTDGRLLIDPGALEEVRNEMYPMLPLPRKSRGWRTERVRRTGLRR